MNHMQNTAKSPLKWVTSAYFAMGLPFVMLNMVCVLMFKGLGIPDSRIALWTLIIMFPWTIKFLWSPFLELVPQKRTVVVGTQILCGTGFAIVAVALHLPAFFALSIALLFVVGFSGATHDIALDGLYMAELVATGLLVFLAGVLIDKREALGDSSFEAALYAWTIIMMAAGVLLVTLGIYHRFVLPEGRRSADSPTESPKNVTRWRKRPEMPTELQKM